MGDTPNTFSPNPQSGPRRGAIEIIIASAMEAFVSALVVWFLGGVAISIAGGFAGDMVPSPPPIFRAQTPSPSHHAKHHVAWGQVMHGYAFAFCFAVFFAHSLWLGFHGETAGPGKRLHRILANLREHWFGLIVGNAISAWVAMLVLNIVQDFSPWQIFWHAIWETVLSMFGGATHAIFGPSQPSTWSNWSSWYSANQAKLNFWFIFLAGAFDDLGVPNFKTLARWYWHRYKKRKTGASTAGTVKSGN